MKIEITRPQAAALRFLARQTGGIAVRRVTQHGQRVARDATWDRLERLGYIETCRYEFTSGVRITDAGRAAIAE